jgi:hypothetical protein
VSEDKAKAEAERQKELGTKRDEAVRSLLNEVKADKGAVQPSVKKEFAPVK